MLVLPHLLKVWIHFQKKNGNISYRFWENMIKTNKYFLLFLFLALALGVFSVIFLKKVLPIFLQPTVYYCQSFFHSFSTKIPTYLGMTLFTALIFFLLFIIGNVVWQAVRIRM